MVAVVCGQALLPPLPARAAGVILPAAPSGFFGLPGPPDGFYASPAGSTAGGGWVDSLLDGLSLGTTCSGTYNSNVAPGQGTTTTTSASEDDFIFTLGGNLNYMSTAPAWTFGGNYSGSYNQYLKNPDFSGYNQSGGVIVGYDVGKLSASFTTNIAYNEGSNRYYSSNFVAQTSINSAFTARYRLSPKTFWVGDMSQSFTTASGGENYNDTQSYAFGTSILWRYSPLTEFGPGIRYTAISGGAWSDRSTIGPTVTVNYKLSKKVMLNSRLGMDFVSYSDGGSSDPTLSTSIGLNYQASKLWGMNFSLYRGAQAETSQAGGVREVTSVNLGYHRKVRRAMLNLSLGYSMDRSENSGNTSAGGQPDRDYFNLNSSLGMPVFGNTSYASVFLQYNDQSGGTGTGSWESFQTGISINRKF